MNINLSRPRLIFSLLAFVVVIGVFVYPFARSTNTEKDLTMEDATNLKDLFVGAVLVTNLGEIEIEFVAKTAPLAVGNFIKLADKFFYDGTIFHRVTKDFIQGGDPLTKEKDISVYGMGGPSYKFRDEVGPDDKIVRGTVAMANSGPNTNGSQFFIVTVREASWLNGKHTIFGKVTSGMNIVDKISLLQTSKNNLPIKPITLERVILKK